MIWFDDPLRTCLLALAKHPALGVWLAALLVGWIPACALVLRRARLDARRGTTPSASLILGPAAPLLLAWLSVIVAVELERADIIPRAFADPSLTFRPAHYAYRFAHECGLLWTASAATIVALPFIAFVTWRVLALRAGPTGAPRLRALAVCLGSSALGVAASALVGPAGVVLVGERNVEGPWHSWSAGPRYALLAVGVLSLATVLALLLVGRRRRMLASAASGRISLGILAFGVLAFALTRARACDAGKTVSLDAMANVPAPESTRCHGEYGSQLRSVGSGWLVLRDRSATFDDRPATPASLGALHGDSPVDRRRSMFLSDVAVFARPGLSLSIVAEWLRALRRMRIDRVVAIVRTTRARETATLGPLPITHYCGHEVRLTDDGAPLSGFRNWGALARAAENSRRIRVAVPIGR